MAAAFLCSDAARFISGIDLVVDGGISSSLAALAPPISFKRSSSLRGYELK